MELRHLRYFVTVAEELHFGRAAQRLNMSQPPLSRQIAELEEELGFLLLSRGYHKVDLTPAGKTYLQQVKRVLDQLDVARQNAAAVAHGQRGYVRLGVGVPLPNGLLPRVVARFSKDHRVHVDILEAPSARMLELLREKAVDAAFLIAPADTTGMTTRELLREPLRVALPASHPLAAAPVIDLRALAEENFVVCRRYAEPGFRELVEKLCAAAGFAPRVLQAAENRQTTLELVAEGLGVAVMVASAALEPSKRVRYLPFSPPGPSLPVVVAWREDPPSDAIAALVDIAEAEASNWASTRPLVALSAAASANGSGDEVASAPGQGRTSAAHSNVPPRKLAER